MLKRVYVPEKTYSLVKLALMRAKLKWSTFIYNTVKLKRIIQEEHLSGNVQKLYWLTE
jgi:hypothetical protein